METKEIVELIITRMDTRIDQGGYSKFEAKRTGIKSRQIVALLEMVVDLGVVSEKNIFYQHEPK